MNRSIALIFGYIPNLDCPNSFAKRFGLLKRFCIALDSYRPDKTDMFFDGPLFVKLLTEICKSIRYDEIEIVFDDTKRQFLKPAELEQLKFEPLDYPEPFEKAFLRQNGIQTCYIQFEPYCSIGGPHPYHDTFAFSFYLNEFNRESLQDLILKKSNSEDVFIRDIVTGQPEPKKIIIGE